MASGSVLEVGRMMSCLPRVDAVMTASFEGRRSGVLVHRVMQASDEPLSVLVAVPKGHRITTLLRDSRMFAVCLIDSTDRRMVRKFEMTNEPLLPAGGDPFELLATRRLVTGAPVLERCVAALDCEIMRHFDLEADHEVYVGLVHAAWVPGGAPGGVAGAVANGRAQNGVGTVMAVPTNGASNGDSRRGRKPAVTIAEIEPEPHDAEIDDEIEDGPV